MKNSKKILVVILIIFISYLYLIENSSPKALTKIKSGKEVTFFVASDIHYLSKDLTDGGEAFQDFVKSSDGRELNYLSEIMDAFANDIKEKKPNVLIISGDLTTNGEKKSHLELAGRLKKIEKMGTSVYVIPGNHDILNPYAREFRGTNQYKTQYINGKEFSEIYGQFGYKEAISRDKTTLSYLAAPSEDVWLLMLDTAQYENNLTLGSPQLDGRVAPETIDWIRQCSNLAKSKGAKLIAVMHHNLIDHSDIAKKGFTINNSREVLQLFEECGIELALSGHIHIQDIKSYKNQNNAIYDISTSCLGIYPQKYGILKYSSSNGIDYSTTSVDVEGWAKKTGIGDNDLIDFKEYSRNAYGSRIYSKVASKLAFDDNYTLDEIKLMAETYKKLNLRSYEGKKEIATDEIKNSPGFKLWLSSESSSSKKNVQRLAASNGEDNNKLHIPINEKSK